MPSVLPASWLPGYEYQKQATVTNIAAGVLAAANHRIVANQPFYLTTLVGASGANLAGNTVYYARDIVLSAGVGVSFQYSLAAAGAAVITGAATSAVAIPIPLVTNTEGISIPLSSLTGLTSANALVATGSISEIMLALDKALQAYFDALSAVNRTVKFVPSNVRPTNSTRKMSRTYTTTVTAETVATE